MIKNIEYVAEVKERSRLEDSLRAAQAVQSALLPKLNKVPGLEFAAHYASAEHTGGDWYGIHFDPDLARLYLQMGDVTGHGIPAALVTASAAGAIASAYSMLKRDPSISLDESLAWIVEAADKAVTGSCSENGLSMTMAFIALDLRSGEGVYLNAAHVPTYLVNAGKLKTLLIPGQHLGMGQEKRSPLRFSFAPGDYLFLYTDGLLENSYGQANRLRQRDLAKLLTNGQALSVLKSSILGLYEVSVETTRPADDVSFLLVGRLPIP